MTSWFFKTLSPGGDSAKLSIFIFHRVLAKADPLLPSEPSAETFDWMVRFISRAFTVLPLSEAASRLRAGTLPPAAAAITFDDGYADNLLVAWPILKRYGIPGTFFIATSFLEGGRMWNDDVIEAFRCSQSHELDLSDLNLGFHRISDNSSRVKCYETVLDKLKYFEHQLRTETAREIARRSAVPDTSDLMMTRSQLCFLHESGAEIGGHTSTHPILQRLDDATALKEIESGKHELEALLKVPLRVFAYPNGVPGRDFSEKHANMACQVGFEAAVSTLQSCATSSSDLFQLPRFTPWDRTPLRFAIRSMLNLRRKS
ncbi:MAG: polysaccharide deacetylase family protein [Pseudomonadota bacterium]